MDAYEATEEEKDQARRMFVGVDEEVVKWAGSIDGDTSGEGQEAMTNLLARHLDLKDATTQTLVVQYACSTLVKSSLPIPTLTAIFTSFMQHEESQVLREALLDVIEVGEEADTDGKDEVEALIKVKKEDAGEEVVKRLDEGLASFTATAKDRSERRLGLARALLESGFLTSELTAHLLDAAHLPPLGVLSSLAKFTSNERRRRTTQFFKQKKYTLLRECSEGWTRLIVLLGDEAMLGAGGDAEDSVERGRRAKLMWRQVLAIIGFFDLSPPRVLDVILDAFGFRLASHWRFFIDLLRVSPWGKRDSGSTSSRPEDGMDTTEPPAARSSSTTEFLDQVSAEQGNTALAQVLGFKFVQFQLIEGDLKGLHREVDATPRDLLLITAILMREGLVRTLDILPHLLPDDSGMNSLALKYARKVKEQIQTLGGNALMNSGPLSDDSAPTTSENAAAGANAAEAPAQTVKKDLVEQRVLLCEALLAIGHLPPAFYLLSRWPVIAQCHPVISDLLLRIVQHQLSPAYALVAAGKPEQADPTPYRPHFAFSDPKELITTSLPVPPDTEKRRFTFFFTEWKRDVVVWDTIEEVAEAFWPIARFLGAMGARDVNVLVQLCRIGVQHMRSERSDTVKKSWLNIIRTCLLPAMPLMPASFSYNNEVWPLLRPFSYTFRYSLYGEWHVAMTDSFEKRTWNPTMALAAAHTMNDAKQVLKRMTSGLERAHARAIGKASYSAPTAMWSVILPQISSYQNMIPTVVEGARYLSEFGWDVTIYMLLDALSDTSKDRVKEDGLSASVWLQGVASFIGTLGRRYSQMDLEPILQQVANQLKARSLADLITLKELIVKMANISPLQNVSPTQVACFSGGRLLYEEGIQVTRSENAEPPKSEADKASMLRSNKRPVKRPQFDKSTKRLVSVLISTGLALPILIGIAQARQISAFVAKARLGHTKQMSLAFDECQGILMQYLQLLGAGMNQEQYAQFIPSLRQSQCAYKLDRAVAHHILRPKIAWQINNREEFLRVRLRKYRKELPEAERELATWDDSHWQAPLLPVMVDSVVASSGRFVNLRLEPFFATFWQLSLSDLKVPEDAYRSSIKWLQTLAQDLNSWKSEAHDSAWADSYKANRLEVLARADSMEVERLSRRKAVEASHARLQAEAPHWFSQFPSAPADLTADGEKRARKQTLSRLHSILHQQCFYPRSTFSMVDATFVASFGKILHKLNTDNFALFVFYEKFFNDSLGAVMFACTETEASNLARCLQLLVEDLERWRGSKDLFMTEGTGEQPDGTFKYQGLRVEVDRILTWGQFQSLCKKWHRKISKATNPVKQAIVGCLASSDYLHVKNGIIIGRGLMPCFPKMKSSQQELVHACKAFLEAEGVRSDARDDLVILVKSYEDALAFAGRDNSASAIKLIADELFSPLPKRAEPPAQVGHKDEPAPSTAPEASEVKDVTTIEPVVPAEATPDSVKPTMPNDVSKVVHGSTTLANQDPPAVASQPVPTSSGAEMTAASGSTTPLAQSTSSNDIVPNLSTLRERLMLNKSTARAPQHSPQGSTSPAKIREEEPVSNGVSSVSREGSVTASAPAVPATSDMPSGPRVDSDERSAVVKGSAASQAPRLSTSESRNLIPTEPRNREPPREPRARQSSRAGDASVPAGPAADMANIPKGPKSSAPPRTPERIFLPTSSRQTSPGDSARRRREPAAPPAVPATSMQPPATRHAPTIPPSSSGTRSRRGSPERTRGYRDSSADSRVSRASDRLKSARDPPATVAGHQDARRERDSKQRDRESAEKARERDLERSGRVERTDEKARDRNGHRDSVSKASENGRSNRDRSQKESSQYDRYEKSGTEREREGPMDDRGDKGRRHREERNDRHKTDQEDKSKGSSGRDDRKRSDKYRDSDRDRERERDREKEREREKTKLKRDWERDGQNGRDRSRTTGHRDDRSHGDEAERERRAARRRDTIAEERPSQSREPRSRDNNATELDPQRPDRSDHRDRDVTNRDLPREDRGTPDYRSSRGPPAPGLEPKPPAGAPPSGKPPGGGSDLIDLLSARFENRRHNQESTPSEIAAPSNDERKRDAAQVAVAGRVESTRTSEVSRDRTAPASMAPPSSASIQGTLAQRITDPSELDRPRSGHPNGVVPGFTSLADRILPAESPVTIPSAPRSTNGIRSAAAIEAAARLLNSDAPLGSRSSNPTPIPTKLGARIAPPPEALRISDLRGPISRPSSTSPTLPTHGLPSRPVQGQGQNQSGVASGSPSPSMGGGSNLAAALSSAPMRDGSGGRTLKRPNEDPIEGAGETTNPPGGGAPKRPRIDRERAKERPARQPRAVALPGNPVTAFSRLSGLIKPADGGGGGR